MPCNLGTVQHRERFFVATQIPSTWPMVHVQMLLNFQGVTIKTKANGTLFDNTMSISELNFEGIIINMEWSNEICISCITIFEN